jgi:hypothetical protein
MKKDQIRNCQAALTVWLVIGLFMPVYALAEMRQAPPTKQMPGIGVEISTEDIKKVLADKTKPVVDVRSPREYSIAHIPVSVNIYGSFRLGYDTCELPFCSPNHLHSTIVFFTADLPSI